MSAPIPDREFRRLIGAACRVLELAPGNDAGAVEDLFAKLESGEHPTRLGTMRYKLPTGRLSISRENVLEKWLAAARSKVKNLHPDRVPRKNAGNQFNAKGENAKSAKVTFRVTARTKSRWVKAAQRSGMNLSEYVSRVCDAEAERLGVR